MSVCLLIRHGENEFVRQGRLAGRLSEVHLNERGLEQAEQVAQYLAGQKISAIYSSPLERTLETARPLSKALGLPVIIRQGLVEVNYGDWQGQELKTLRRKKLWKVVQGTPSLMRFPGGETFIDAQQRMHNELEELAARHKKTDVFVCFSHGDAIRLVAAFYLGLPLDLFQRLHVSPASITSLEFSAAGRRLISINCEGPKNIPGG